LVLGIRLIWAGLVITFAGCGAEQGGVRKNPPGDPARSDAGAFVAAPYPPAGVCGMLTFADVQPLLPNVDGTYTPDPLTPNGYFWINNCNWGSTPPAGVLELSLTGALTPDANAGLDSDITDVANADASVQWVMGVGARAVYVNRPGLSQTLDVRFKSYLITLWASSFTPDVPEALLQPLALKVIAQL
jgi:hypothetical protein